MEGASKYDVQPIMSNTTTSTGSSTSMNAIINDDDDDVENQLLESTSSLPLPRVGDTTTLSVDTEEEEVREDHNDNGCRHEEEADCVLAATNQSADGGQTANQTTLPILSPSRTSIAAGATSDDAAANGTTTNREIGTDDNPNPSDSNNNDGGIDDDETADDLKDDNDDFAKENYTVKGQSVEEDERLCLLAAMDESLKEGNPDYYDNSSNNNSIRKYADNGQPQQSQHQQQQQQQQQGTIPPTSPTPATIDSSPTTNFLQKRSESIHRKHQMLNIRSQSYSQRLRAWRGNNSQSMSSQQQQQDTDSEKDEDEVDDDAILMMMIAKKRAAMGEDYADDNEDVMGFYGNNNNDNNNKQQSNNSGGSEPQRPGAYSKSPGETYQRVGSFRKESFIVGGRTEKATLLPPRSSSSPARKRSPTRRRTSPQRIGRKQRLVKKRMMETMSKEREEGEGDSDLDRKPAAKPSAAAAVPPPPSLTKRHTTVLCGSSHTPQLERSDTTESQRSKNRAKSLPCAAAAAATTYNKTSTTSGIRLRRQRTPHSSISTHSSISSCGRSSDRTSLNLASLVRSMTQDNNNRTSLSLASLAHSMTLDSNNSSSSSDLDISSAHLIADIAEQSVNNFVRSFHNNNRESYVHEAAANNTTTLPIAATVVPSEEDLEGLIRSRLEAELKSHLTQELSQFRQNLFQGIIRRGHVQVADPVLLEAGNDYYDADNSNKSNSSNNNENIHVEFDGIDRDHNYRTLLEVFHDEEDGSQEDLSDSDRDQVTDLDAAQSTSNQSLGRRPNLRDDFRRSIRQSLRMELGNLEEELDVEQAQVITPSTGIRTGSGDGTVLEPTLSSTQDDVSATICPHQQKPTHHIKKNFGKDKQFVFSSRSLLGWLFIVFLFGALIGAGTAIWAMQSIQGD